MSTYKGMKTTADGPKHVYQDKDGNRIELKDHTPPLSDLKYGNGDSYSWGGKQ